MKRGHYLLLFVGACLMLAAALSGCTAAYAKPHDWLEVAACSWQSDADKKGATCSA